MKALTVLCNVVFLSFTALVLVTDGISRQPAYIVLTLLLMLVPLFTLIVLLTRSGESRPAEKNVAEIANLALLVLIGWAFMAQYPHPREAGFVPYLLLALFTPALSVAVLFFQRGGRPAHPSVHTP